MQEIEAVKMFSEPSGADIALLKLIRYLAPQRGTPGGVSALVSVWVSWAVTEV